MRRLAPLTVAATLLAAPMAQAQSSLVLSSQPGGDTKPLWEVGFFLGGARLPDYPAAGQSQTRVLPLPYVIYRGDVFKIGDGGGVRAEADITDRIEFSLGFSGSFDSDSEDNRAREGMPDLDLLAEAGPAVAFRLTPRKSDLQAVLSLEARAVISLDFDDIGYQGIAVNPKLTVQHRDFLGSGLGLYLSAGPVWGFDGVNEYFYEVEPRFARAGRPAYRAEEGYVGTRANIGVSAMVSENVRLFAGTQISYHGGAENEDSPLFREKWTVGVGAGLTWSIWQSEQRVPAKD